MTNEHKLLSRRYLTYKFLTSLWFVGAVWLYFYRIFITDQQVGVLDGMAFAIGLLAEVPSGALADKFGRDRIVKLGQVLAGSGLLIQATGSSFMPFFVGQAIMMIGVAFVSGADEALFFERLKFSRKSVDWRKLVTRGSQVALMATLLATVVGGLLHTINPRLPWYLNGLAFIVSIGAIWSVKDTRPRAKREKFMPELKSYFVDIKMGFAEFSRPKLRLYVPYILAVQGLFYTTGYGLLRLILLDRFTFSPFWGSVAIASSSLITVGLLAYMHKNAEDLSERNVLVIIGLIASSSLLLSLANIGLFGYIVILALYAGEHVLQPFLSEVLNHRASDDRRATVLSVASFLKSLPYVLLAPIIGYLSSNDKIEYFFIAWAGIIFFAVLLYISQKKQDTHISLTD
ncbi:TPA: MFS transporter [Candidatus Saccharibacteria bacterium]|nr:MFS transporter [Candidatus Saccharibacteria bacterium]HIO87663.1 MFS transporter [Candidatus Saccharibacteria bacterium]